MLAIGRDFVHAARSLMKRRGFTIVCVASLGIGMATVIGALVFARALSAAPPLIDGERLVELLVTREGPLLSQAGTYGSERWSYPDFEAIRDADIGMELTAWVIGESDLETSEAGAPLQIPTMFVSTDYFSIVGVELYLGSGFDSSIHEGTAAEPAVILEYEFWENRLSSDPSIVGQTLTLDGVPHVVVGIAPETFRGHVFAGARVFVPIAQHSGFATDRGNRAVDWVRVHGSLSPGLGIQQANAAIASIMTYLAEEYPATNEFKSASVEPYVARGARAVASIRATQTALLGLSLLVLLVVCLNVSGMMLVRGVLRERELSIRQAVGAGRAHLLRYLMTESVLLAAFGTIVGILALYGGFAALAWRIGRPPPVQLQFDFAMISACAGLCLVASIMFGLLPALRFSRPALISATKDDGRMGGRRVGLLHRVAAAIQITLVLPFLVLGGIALNQARTVGAADLGFDPESLAAVRVELPDNDRESFIRGVRESLEQTGGIGSVTVAEGLPLDFRYRYVRVSASEGTNFRLVQSTRIGEEYLGTMGIGLLRGREFTRDDREGSADVAIISEPLARQLYPNASAIGEQIRLAPPGSAEERAVTVVGITADFATSQMTTPRAQVLLPLAQHPVSSLLVIARGTSGTEIGSLPVSKFETFTREFDPNFFASGLVTGEALVRNSIEDFVNQSRPAFAGGSVVIALAALGIYGVIGFMVATRTREIAVRIALGATRRHVLGIVSADVLRLVLPGLAAGMLITAVIVRTVFSIYPLTAMDPIIYVAAAGIALSVALLASIPAARRASRVEPMVSLQSE